MWKERKSERKRVRKKVREKKWIEREKKLERKGDG